MQENNLPEHWRYRNMTHFAWPLQRMQLPSHCGPCSLSACFFLLGINATQRDVARAAGILPSFKVWKHGLNDKELCRAAGAYGITHRIVFFRKKGWGSLFVKRLRKHLETGNPALLLVGNLDHWVAVVGFLEKEKRFVVLDTERNGTLFYRWSRKTLLARAWNISDDESEPSQYFAILWSRKDKLKAKWTVTDSLLRLCKRGSDDTAENMAHDLSEIARRASGGRKSISTGPYLAEILETYKEEILRSIKEWGEGSPRISEEALRDFYDDYQSIAAASGIRVSKRVDKVIVVSHVTSLLSSYWWGAKF